MRPAALPLLCLAVALAAPHPARADTLVVLNKAADTATLLDLASGRERATLAVGAGPHEAAVSPDGRWALVANYGRPGAPGQSMSLVDVAAARVVATHRLGRYDRPHGIAWHGDTAWVTAEGGRPHAEEQAIEKAGDLARGADGSIEVVFSRDPPTGPRNWLPTPEGPWRASFRAYLPQSDLLSGRWTPPSIVRAQ